MAIWEDYEAKAAVPMKAAMGFPKKEGMMTRRVLSIPVTQTSDLSSFYGLHKCLGLEPQGVADHR